MVFGLVAGPPWSTEFAAAGQLAALAASRQEEGPHGETGPRIAPLISDADDRNMVDLLVNPSTDFAIVPLPTLNRAARARPGFTARIGYVAPLYLQEVQIVAGRDIVSLNDLRGKRVAVGPPDGIGTILMETLALDVQRADIPFGQALDQLGTGDLAAVVVVSGKPVQGLADIGPDRRLHILPIPYSQPLETDFVPASFTPSDYKALVDSDTPTVAVKSVLAAYIWPPSTARARVQGALVSGLLDAASTPSPRQEIPKLNTVNWGATLPGWRRIDVAERWLKAYGSKRSGAGRPDASGAKETTR